MSRGDGKGRAVSRRQFLHGLLCLAVVPVAPASRAADTPWSELDRHWLAAGALPDAARLGRAYLRQVPAEASADVLARALFGDLADDRLVATDRHRLAAGLRARRRDDCRRGDLVQLDGWLIPRSEARLLALIALSPVA